jgi:AcrR family transcriptional regulator
VSPRASKPGEGTRQRILAVAVELFAEKGFHGTGVAEIGDRVELGRGALYHHIRTKDEVLFEVLSLCVDDELLESAEKIQASDSSTEEKIHQLSSHLLNDIAEHRAAWTVYFRDADKLSPRYHDQIQARRSHYEKIWLDVLLAGVKSEELAEFDPVVVKGILGMHNYSYMWIRPGGRLTATQIASAYASMIFAGLKKQ